MANAEHLRLSVRAAILISRLAALAILAACLYETYALTVITLPLAGQGFWLTLFGCSALIFLFALYRTLRAARVPPAAYGAIAYAGAVWIYLQYIAPQVSQPFGYLLPP